MEMRIQAESGVENIARNWWIRPHGDAVFVASEASDKTTESMVAAEWRHEV